MGLANSAVSSDDNKPDCSGQLGICQEGLQANILLFNRTLDQISRSNEECASRLARLSDLHYRAHHEQSRDTFKSLFDLSQLRHDYESGSSPLTGDCDNGVTLKSHVEHAWPKANASTMAPPPPQKGVVERTGVAA